MIGENMQAPADLHALCLAAEERSFPILLTQYGVPFAAVTRAIVEASRQVDHQRRSAITRLYESARMGLQGLGLARLLQRLEKDVQASLKLLDAHSLEPWLPESAGLPEEQRAALIASRLELAGSNQPVAQRHRLEQGEVLLMTVPSQPNCIMLAQGNWLLDYALLHHAVAVLGIELERLRAEFERNLRLGSELLDDLLLQRLSLRQAEERLGQFGASIEHIRLAVARPGQLAIAEYGEALQRHGMHVLLRAQGEELILLFWNDIATQLQSLLHSALGISNPLGHPERCSQALREARLALAHSDLERPLLAYDQVAGNAPWLPQNLDEATQTYRRILGTLADYDQVHGTALLYSLHVFLTHNRSWLSAAQQLHVHKQTLVYRVRRIEAITGRSLDSTEGVAILWFALRAAELVGIDLTNPPYKALT